MVDCNTGLTGTQQEGGLWLHTHWVGSPALGHYHNTDFVGNLDLDHMDSPVEASADTQGHLDIGRLAHNGPGLDTVGHQLGRAGIPLMDLAFFDHQGELGIVLRSRNLA